MLPSAPYLYVLCTHQNGSGNPDRALKKHAAIQVSSCSECQSLSPLTDGSSENSCVRCDQVDDLLSLMVELQEEVERLRNIWEPEKEIDWWNHALPSLRQPPEKNPKILYPSPARLKAVD